jgi:CheY-like chemotaxis protein
VVLLPQAPREEFSPPPAVPFASPRGNGETLLLVEDEPSLRVCMVELLKDAGFCVLDAADGVDALRLLQEGAVDLVLSDVMMPRMNGLELARRLSVEHPETRMVLFTGYANEEAIRSSLDGTGIPLVRKPFEFRQLLAVLHSELAVRQVSRD